MVAEDDLDLESLQAQIDTSMSFAQSLVTSWINPTRLAQLGNSANATQILEEELRRPPRLGVGAPIPMVSPLAHEASKLKRRLGKNGAKNEGVVKLQPQDSTNTDDEERKGRPAKRKTKIDPFGHQGSKKKRKAESVYNTTPVENISKHSVSLQSNLTLREPQKHNSLSSQVIEELRSTTLVSSPSARLPSQTTFSPRLIASAIPPLSEPSREISAPDPGNISTPESSRLHTNSMLMPDKAKPLGVPLLNLDGPPELTNQLGIASELNNSRRKRKRRKKKKTLIAGTAR